MVNETSVDILFISLLVLFVILVVLVVLFWVYRHFKDRNLTLMKISVGQPPLQLAIRTKPQHAQELMDHLLERFAMQVETVTEEPSQDHDQENVADLSNIPNIISKKMSQLIGLAVPSWQANKAQRTPSFSSVCPDTQDEEAQPASSTSEAQQLAEWEK